MQLHCQSDVALPHRTCHVAAVSAKPSAAYWGIEPRPLLRPLAFVTNVCAKTWSYEESFLTCGRSTCKRACRKKCILAVLRTVVTESGTAVKRLLPVVLDMLGLLLGMLTAIADTALLLELHACPQQVCCVAELLQLARTSPPTAIAVTRIAIVQKSTNSEKDTQCILIQGL